MTFGLYSRSGSMGRPVSTLSEVYNTIPLHSNPLFSPRKQGLFLSLNPAQFPGHDLGGFHRLGLRFWVCGNLQSRGTVLDEPVPW